MNSANARPTRYRACEDTTVSSRTAASEDQQSNFTGALAEFSIQCPNCSHRFTLCEGLLLEDDSNNRRLAETASAAAYDAADTARDSVESLAMDGMHGVGKETLLKVASGSCGIGESVAASSVAGATADEDERTSSEGNGGIAGDDAKSSNPVVVRSYQITNWTVEELEKVICDPNDRRIRKISSISQCDIEVRSEIAPTKFGAPKNFCLLRAPQAVNIDQCRSLLKRQLLWVLKPKSHGEGDSPSPAR